MSRIIDDNLELTFTGGPVVAAGVETEVGSNPLVRRIVSAPTITSLTQIGREWRTVAIQDAKVWGMMTWDWSLHNGSGAARTLLEDAIRDGVVLSVQGRTKDGSYALYAKLAKHQSLPSSFKKFVANQVGARA